MPLIVPVLRLSVLFLNIYETFKTLKLPLPSPRNSGRPSERAMTQRKRNMKGCLAVWIVWCCFAMYERTLDRLVGFVVPFYDEIKSVVLIFLLITRARGAEPIYLHVIRPLIKPYAGTLDNMFDLTSMVGDIVFAIMQIPIRLALPYWEKVSWRIESATLESDGDVSDTTLNKTGAQKSKSASRSNSNALVPAFFSHTRESQIIGHALDKRSVPSRAPSRGSRSLKAHHESKGGSHSRRLSMDAFAPPEPDDRVAISAPKAAPSVDREMPRPHEIWYPPPSAYAELRAIDIAQVASIAVPIPPHHHPTTDAVGSSLVGMSSEHAVNEMQSDDWRNYPAFPSAYPPTPLPAYSRLPPSSQGTIQGAESLAPAPRYQPSATCILPIAEHTPEEKEPDFGLSLQQPHEPTDPGPSRSSSDNGSNSSRVHSCNVDVDQRTTWYSMQNQGTDETDDYNEDRDDEEDDFDVTLRTPQIPQSSSSSLRQIHDRLEPTGSTDSLSKSSLLSRSTALTTVDNGSSLRTRTTSESSSSFLATSDSSSIAGVKRSLPRARPNIIKSKGMLRETSAANGTIKNATITKRPGGGTPYRKLPEVFISEKSDDDDNLASSESDGDGNADDFGVKRRKVASSNVETSLTTRAKGRDNTRRLLAVSKHPSFSTRGRSTAMPQGRIRASSRMANSQPGSVSRSSTASSSVDTHPPHMAGTSGRRGALVQRGRMTTRSRA